MQITQSDRGCLQDILATIERIEEIEDPENTQWDAYRDELYFITSRAGSLNGQTVAEDDELNWLKVHTSAELLRTPMPCSKADIVRIASDELPRIKARCKQLLGLQ